MSTITRYLWYKFIVLTIISYVIFLACLICPVLARASYVLSTSYLSLQDVCRAVLSDLFIIALNISPIISLVATAIFMAQLSRSGELQLIYLTGVTATHLAITVMTFSLIPCLLVLHLSTNYKAFMVRTSEGLKSHVADNLAISSIEANKVIKHKDMTIFINELSAEDSEMHGFFLSTSIAGAEVLIVSEKGALSVFYDALHVRLQNAWTHTTRHPRKILNDAIYSVEDAHFKKYSKIIPILKESNYKLNYSEIDTDDLIVRLISQGEIHASSRAEVKYGTSQAPIISELLSRMLYPILILTSTFGIAVANTAYPLGRRSVTFKRLVSFGAMVTYVVLSVLLARGGTSTTLGNTLAVANILLTLIIPLTVSLLRRNAFHG